MNMKIKLNENYKNLKKSYLFSEIAKRVKAYGAENPDKKIIRLGIGDVTLPLTKSVTDAMTAAVAEMGKKETFRGYAPEYGYDFLREAISRYYKRFGTDVPAEEIFVSDGAKSDVGNITEIFGDNPVLIPDPVYPVYFDSNVMSGRNVTFIRADEKNGFLPTPAGLSGEGYIIYLCSPNNPTGRGLRPRGACRMGEFRPFHRLGSSSMIRRTKRISTETTPIRSMKSRARERAPSRFAASQRPRALPERAARGRSFRPSFPRTACRCARCGSAVRRRNSTACRMWCREAPRRRFRTPALPSAHALVTYYMENAAMIADVLREKGIFFTGGTSSPYIWMRCTGGMDSWSFFDALLHGVQVVGTPGAGLRRLRRRVFPAHLLCFPRGDGGSGRETARLSLIFSFRRDKTMVAEQKLLHTNLTVDENGHLLFAGADTVALAGEIRHAALPHRRRTGARALPRI